MKRILTVMIAALLACAVFAACSQQAQTQTVTGTINEGSTMNVYTIDLEDGSTASFIKTDETDLSGLPDGAAIGTKVTITYTGDIKNQEDLPTAVKIAAA